MQKSHERKALLFWCEKCNVPLLKEKCGNCGSKGRKMLFRHGLEMRPGFEYTVARINRILEENYGVSNALSQKLIFLHKVAGLDRTEEIILDGEIFGTLAYIPEQKKFQIYLRRYGAWFLREKAKKNIAFVDEKVLKRHLKNSYVGFEEIKEWKDVTGDVDVILAIGNYTGVGVVSSERKRVRVRDIGKFEGSKREAKIEEVIKANIEALKEIEAKAIGEIKRIIANTPYKLGVSFSGGKDSAVAMHLLSKCRQKFFVLFVNTGLEFPETVEYVKAMANGRELLVLWPEQSFWELVEKMGPPAKDYRWCCKVCKLAPVAKYIAQHGKILCVEGRRRAESFAREKIELVEQNPFVPGQILLNPIRDWSAFEVWLYILWQKIPINRLYFHDFERIGCYLCPAEQVSEFEEVSILHPEMYNRWINFLKAWAAQHSLPDEFWQISWRWKLPPKKVRAKENVEERMEVKVFKTCDGVLLQGNFPFRFGRISALENALGILGETMEKYNAIVLKTRNASLLFFSDGDFTISSKQREDADHLLLLMTKQLLRALFCTACKICLSVCKAKAIRISNGKVEYDLSACKKCLKCIESCVVARYYDKKVKIVYSLEKDLGMR